MRAVIVDDERIARRELRRLLTAHPEIEIVGEAADGEDALVVIQRQDPDLLFLDIEMPGSNRAHRPGWLRLCRRCGAGTRNYGIRFFSVTANGAGSCDSPISKFWNPKAITPGCSF
jgi:CheY-like chemotaxis protein